MINLKNFPIKISPSISRRLLAGVVFTGLVFIYVVSIGIKNLIRYNAFKFEQKGLIKSLEKEQKIHQDWTDRFDKTHSDEFWELEAKRRLGFTKQGEVVYKLINPSN